MLTLLLSLAACDGTPKPSGDDTGYRAPSVDADRDGWALDEDCDDDDDEVNPGAQEICDGNDNDCDGTIDEDVADTFYTDADGDGFGDPGSPVTACDPPADAVANGTDCDDSSAATYPGADETCDGADNDCDTNVDEDLGDTFYADADGDGYGDSAVPERGCTAPDGYVPADGDCDDSDPAYHPDADETDCEDPNDYNCDGSVGYSDNDGDGYPACQECDDGSAGVHPGGSEVCNGVDDDCDGSVDNGAPDAVDWYADADGDGYGDAASVVNACDAPAGYVAVADDCDDGESTTNPGALEACDGVDNDCDGVTDEDSADRTTFYADSDGDGYGDPGTSATACAAPSGYVTNRTDCDDTDAAVSPSGTEMCNGLDDDCDGSTDESAADVATWYEDRDEDGFGDPARSTTACDAPEGYVAAGTDCDDLAVETYPGAAEVCDGDDNDCDGTTDEGAVDAGTWYADTDGDGYGDAGVASIACDAAAGEVADGSDCDDGTSSVHPGAAETCNGTDDDCDGATDETGATGERSWYADTDGDGYGDAGVATTACDSPTGYTASATDCDDSDGTVNPAALETCDGVDEDCDGTVDESSAVDAATWYQDRDEDGYGDSTRTTVSCDAPDGYVATATDCDDLDVSSHPGATEVCDAADNDCDGSTDESASDALTWYADADGDTYGNAAVTSTACTAPSGYVATTTDCDDAAASVHPGATETCNSVDDDCDGSVDEAGASGESTYYADADGDGFGSSSSTTRGCSAPSGYVTSSTDCDDTDAAIRPTATELCDGDDNDCDGTVDESSAADATTWYQDRDSDTYGDATRTSVSCSAPSGYVASSTDCNDLAAGTHPGASEVCDSADNDCDGSVDESATDAVTWYRDADTDGYGVSTSTSTACTQPSGYVATATDCDDADSSEYPGATEVCDGDDDDCDGSVDEAGASGASTYYRDADGDSYGSSTSTTTGCTTPSGYVSVSTDCDDADSTIHPGATEYCDGTDDDCDGSEDGTVTFVSSAGATSDVSTTWGTGTSSSPTTMTLASAGTYTVCDGTYYVSLSITGDVTIQGLNGESSVELNGGGTKRVAAVSSSADVVLDGLTIANGYNSSYGGNLYAVSGTGLSLSEVTLTGGVSPRGANLACTGCTVDLDDVLVESGTSTLYGGGLYVTSASVTGNAVTVSGNSALTGAGLYVGTSTSAAFTSSEISGNDASTSGGGAYVTSSTLTLSSTDVEGNTATSYGGGVYVASSTLVATTANIDGNEAGTAGGGAYMTGASSSLSCTGTTSGVYGIWGNTATIAGGVYMAATSGIGLTSTRCDWTATSDNTLYDIVVGTSLYYTKADNATFTCSYTGC